MKKVFLLILIIAAGCIEWAPKDEYEIFSYLPNQNISSAAYVIITEEGVKELSSLLGEWYGNILKKFKEAKLAFITYVDEERVEVERGSVIYLKTELSVDETLKLIEENIAGFPRSHEGEPLFKTEKKVIAGKEITTVEDFFGQNNICLWKEGEWIKMVGFGMGRYNCEETLKEKYNTKNAKEFLKEAEEIKKKIKKEGVVFGEVAGVSRGEIFAGGVSFGDDIGDYLIVVARSPYSSKSCHGEIVERNGREACFVENRWAGFYHTPVSADRMIGNYTIMVMAHPKELKSKVEKKVEDIIFSIELPGEEVKWEKR